MLNFADQIIYFMKRVQVKRNYIAPASVSAEVVIEQSLLVATARFLLNVNETTNMNIVEGSATSAPDAEGGDLYFEF